jgi:ketoreductase RED2
MPAREPEPPEVDRSTGGESLDGAVAVVTGSSSGIGAAIARALARQGVRVVVNSAGSTEAGTAVAASLPDAIYVQADVSRADEAARLSDAAAERWGRLDIVVNCAATSVTVPHADLDGVDEEMWERALGVNLVGAWNVIRAALPQLYAAAPASVVNVSSIAGSRPLGSSIPYSVSKAGLNHLTVLLANALAPRVRVNAVAPGYVETPWTADWPEERRSEIVGRTPLQRAGSAEDVASMCVAVARNVHMTGQIVRVDGGLSL